MSAHTEQLLAGGLVVLAVFLAVRRGVRRLVVGG